MAAVIADTHAILWFLTNPEKLSPKALEALRAASEAGDMVYVSAITVVEATYLAEKRKIGASALRTLDHALADKDVAIEYIPVDLPVVHAVRRISRDVVADMPDRIIAATALDQELPLVTRDPEIKNVGIDTIW
jgi:PIN domain nuclease of toxin-antitoxin system